MQRNETDDVFSTNMFRFLHLVLISALLIVSCRKAGMTEADVLSVRCSADTVRFDTVFTTTGSVTSGFLIYNTQNQDLRIRSIRLAGGFSSAFQINVDGTPGPQVQDIRINRQDSIYLFVTVRINPNSGTLPFIVKDSILLDLNGKETKVVLEAWGQNARFLRNTRIASDTRFDNRLPYVILGGLGVDKNVRLTMEAGTKIFLHADAPILVDGSLITEGTADKPVVFTGDRLDEQYRELPASWPGIYLRPNSVDNLLTHARILNAYNGIVVEGPSTNGRVKLKLDRCVIHNAFETGIAGAGSWIEAENCQITNCGRNILLFQGGRYQFSHCTVSSYSNAFIPHKYPVLTAQNWDSTKLGVKTFPMQLQVVNSIMWGDEGTVEQEVSLSRRGTDPFQISLVHSLFRGVSDPAPALLTNCIRNQSPQFDSINTTKRYFDFRLQRKNSPAINKGLPGVVRTDLDDRARDGNPDLGAFEKQ
jgi:hypothetical protein